MKNTLTHFTTFLFAMLLLQAGAWSQQKKPVSISISGEHINIETLGDVLGYSIVTGIHKFYTPSINLGVEYRFASGATETSLIYSFYHKSISYLEPQIRYYPFHSFKSISRNRFIQGLHIGVGPSVFYGKFSQESFWRLTIDQSGQVTDRLSRIVTQKSWDIGYLILAGYEVNITKGFTIGARMDLTSYRKHDGYAALGLSAGFLLP